MAAPDGCDIRAVEKQRLTAEIRRRTRFAVSRFAFRMVSGTAITSAVRSGSPAARRASVSRSPLAFPQGSV